MLQFAFVFRTERDAKKAVEALGADGYEVEIQRIVDGWTVNAVSVQPIRDVEAVRAEMNRLASALGGEFLGHGGLASRGRD